MPDVGVGGWGFGRVWGAMGGLEWGNWGGLGGNWETDVGHISTVWDGTHLLQNVGLWEAAGIQPAPPRLSSSPTGRAVEGP